MTGPGLIDEARRRQIEAADPGRSSWVAANAGSGKTSVLTDRVARLLVSGADPARILCLTYTTAAASEMQNRLFALLGGWVMKPDDALGAALAELGEPGPFDAAALMRARTLFARALETPGGLKIQTIHAFCDRLLRQFPAECGVAPGFVVMQDREARQLRTAAIEALADSPGGPDGNPIDAIAPWLVTADQLDWLAQAVRGRAAAFAAPLDEARLRGLLGLPPQPLTATALLDGVLGPDGRALLGRLLRVLEQGSTNDMKAAEKLAPALANRDHPDGLLAVLEDILLTGEGANQPFQSKAGKFPTKGSREALGTDVEALDAMMDRVAEARLLRLAEAAFVRTRALHGFARGYLAHYQALKTRRGRLDFDDLIEGAARLLTGSEAADWVLYRLDGGIDHVLVDEAQDTSPAQWQVIRALTAEFFAGLGAEPGHRPGPRTIFVVGDEKQSIYSFQGAEPAAFAGSRQHFDKVLAEAVDPLALCELLYSFRTAPVILALVDSIADGLPGVGRTEHHPFWHNLPGRVELWPFLETVKVEGEDIPWYTPLDMLSPADRRFELARAIAADLKRRIGRPLPGGDKPLRPGEVLILLRKRAELFRAVIRELKNAGLAVAGADRLVLADELAVKDLLALLRVVATPEDDLSLAAVLRSPLGGFSEADLFAVAHGRHGTLLQALHRDGAPRAEITALIDELGSGEGFRRPYELLERVLTVHGGRRKLLARLGPEAEDGIDELLAQALAYENVEPPSLIGFLDWIGADDVQIKRAQDARGEDAAGLIRVMTVHGAKGLEADLVILPDTGEHRTRSDKGVLLLDDGTAVWDMSAAEAPRVVADAAAAAAARERAELDRLFYVAMTRARRALILCGAGRRARDNDDWFGRATEAMTALGARREAAAPQKAAAPEKAAQDGDGPVAERLILGADWPGGDGPQPEPAPEPAPTPQPELDFGPPAEPRLPAWARAPAPPAPPAARSLAPTALGGAHTLGGTEADPDATERGRLMHLLLERLPPLPPGERPVLAAALVAAEAPGLAPGAGQPLVEEALSLIADPALAAVFDPGALAEVPVTAALPALGGARITGVIDRLILGPGRALAVDFKTNAAVPGSAAETPEAILRQLGAYLAALEAIWPGREAAVAVLWTRTRHLMSMPRDLVMAALGRAAREAVDPDPPDT